jgi:hypothetical protein
MLTPRHHQLRKVAVSLAAVTAVVGLAACDIGLGTPGAAAPTSVPTSVAAVPVGSVEELEPSASAEAPEPPADEAGADGGAEEEAPGDGAAEEEAPADGAPAEEAPAEGEEAPVDGAPVVEAPAEGEEAPADGAPVEETPATEAPAAPPAPPANNGLEVLGTDCSNSDLEPHTGFQEAPRCVQSSHGEVASADNSPSLLITDFPATIGAGEAFDIQVSTRNLVRDRFLGAAAGGYYLESSFLNAEGIQRGHFHTACRILPSEAEAPDAAPVPEFFLATQDNGGGSEADQVVVPVTGLDEPGTYQCSVWAGDGSHRTPLMQRANQTPAFDSVRITVT